MEQRGNEDDKDEARDRDRRRVLDLERDEPEDGPEEVTLDRDETLRDLRELQELSIERASGRSTEDDD